MKEAARFLSSRLSIRIGHVTDRDLIFAYKKRYGNRWFMDSVYSNVIVFQRFDNKYFPIDIYEQENMNSKSLVNTFSKLSLLPINEYTFESEKLL